MIPLDLNFEKRQGRKILQAMEETFSKEIRPTLDIIDQLRAVGLSQEVSLPQIVVMGDQSSGKSSVLQSIAGIPFPRGSGLVTRCPIELILKRAEDPSSAWSADVSIRWDKEQPAESGPASDMDALLTKIQRLSDILASTGVNGFSHHSIVVRVVSKDSPDLTLIDLPGIVRTATAGQDRGVIEQVNSLIDSYSSSPNTIILAVVPCNQDIATIDILERAARADPVGIRTIGVLTKPDLIGPGGENEAVEVILNKKKPLKLGYVMVKNLSSLAMKSITSSTESIAKSREEEMEYFSSHPVFGPLLDRNLFGVSNLIKVLSRILVQHIRRTLPSIIKDVRILLSESKMLQTKLGYNPQETGDVRHSLMKKMNEYCHYFRKSSRGEYRESKGLLAISEPEVRMHYLLSQRFKVLHQRIMEQRPLFEREDSPESILLINELRSHKGRDLPGFFNMHVFSSCMVMFIEEWRASMEEVLFDTRTVIHQSAQKLAQVYCQNYPALQEALFKIVQDLAGPVYEECRDDSDKILAKELEPFTSQDVLLEVVNSIRFRAFDNVLKQVVDSIDPKAFDGNRYQIEEEIKKKLGNWYMRRHGVDSQGNLQEMITLVQAYWDIASRRFIDNICMHMEKGFVAKVVGELETQATLFAVTCTEKELSALMEEDVEIARKRAEIAEKIKVLQAAADILDSASLPVA